MDEKFQALESQIEFQANLLKHINDAVIAVDNQFCITVWNQAAETLYGWSAAEVTGQPLQGFIQNEYINDTREDVIKAVLERGIWKGEVTQQRKDGKRIPISASVSLVKDKAGKPIGFVAINRDISDRKQAEQEIASLAKFPDENINPVLRFNKNGKLLYANPASKRLLNEWGCKIGDSPPEEIQQVISESLATALDREIESAHHNIIYSLIFVPLVNKDYVNVYARDITQHKHAEEALSASQQLLHNIIDNSTTLIYALDLEGRFLVLNHRLETLFGVSHEALIGKTRTAILPPDIAELHRANDLQVIARRQPVTFEEENEEADGKHTYLSVKFPLSNAKGDVYGIGGISTDITDRKNAEAFIYESERFAHSTLDALSAHLAILDENGTIISVNNAWRRFAEVNAPAGSTKLLCEGANYLKVCDNASVRGVDEAIRMAASIRAVMAGNQEDHSLEYPCHAPWENRWFVARVTRFSDHGPLRIVVAHENITERRQAEQTLLESEDSLKKSQAVAHIGHWTWDTRTNIVYWSDEMKRIFGINPDDFDGSLDQVIQNAIHPDDRQRIMAMNEAVTKDGKPQSTEYRVILKDGSIRHIWAEPGESVQDEQGNIIQLSGIVQDITERKQAELQLKESEGRLRLVTNASPNAMVMAEADGRISFANDAAISLFGYTHAELINASLETLIPERFRASHPLFRESFFTDSHPRPMGKGRDLYALRKDGSEVPVEIGLSPVETNEGLFALATITDISERKKAEAALRDSEDKFKYIFDHSIVGKSITLPNGSITVNKAFCDMLGYSEQELINKKWQEITHPDDIELSSAAVKPLLAGEKDSTRFTKRYIHKNGLVVWTDVSTSLRRDEQGQPVYFMTSMIDITERKQAEDQIKDLAMFNEKVINNSPIGILTYKLSGECILANENAAAIIGTSVEQLQMQNFHSIDSWKKSGLYDLVEQAITTRLPVTADIRHLSTFGNDLWLTAYAVIFKEKDEDHVLLTITDITKRKQAEEAILKLNNELEERVVLRTHQLEAANKELEAFSYSVSHDLRAPLRSIDGFSKILLEDYNEQIPPEGLQHLSRIRIAAQRMAELIDDLLNLARITRTPMQPQLFNLSEIAQAVANTLKEQNPDRSLTVNITPDLMVNGDPALLKIALENLLSNAWKFTSKKEQALIEFGTEVKDEEQLFFVRDNGAGFDMTYVNKLFGVFQRLHSTSDYPGTGVGLATVQRIIKIHGGRIWAEAEESKGAIFYFTL